MPQKQEVLPRTMGWVHSGNPHYSLQGPGGETARTFASFAAERLNKKLCADFMRLCGT